MIIYQYLTNEKTLSNQICQCIQTQQKTRKHSMAALLVGGVEQLHAQEKGSHLACWIRKHFLDRKHWNRIYLLFHLSFWPCHSGAAVNFSNYLSLYKRSKVTITNETFMNLTDKCVTRTKPINNLLLGHEFYKNSWTRILVCFSFLIFCPMAGVLASDIRAWIASQNYEQ